MRTQNKKNKTKKTKQKILTTSASDNVLNAGGASTSEVGRSSSIGGACSVGGGWKSPKSGTSGISDIFFSFDFQPIVRMFIHKKTPHHYNNKENYDRSFKLFFSVLLYCLGWSI